MRNQVCIRGWIGGLMFALATFSSTATAVDGRVFYISGGAYAERGGDRIPLQEDSIVQTGDVIVTKDDGRVQFRMADDSYFALKPNSRFKIAEYSQGAPKTGSGGKAFYELLAGGFRNLTGLIGKQDHATYRVSTPVATLGIRGTDYTAIICNNDCQFAEKAGNKVQNGLYLRIDVGAVAIANAGGSIEAKAGQYVYVESSGSIPVILADAPIVFLNWTEDFKFRFRWLRKELERIEPDEILPGPVPSPN